MPLNVLPIGLLTDGNPGHPTLLAAKPGIFGSWGRKAMKLEDIKPGDQIRGIKPGEIVTIMQRLRKNEASHTFLWKDQAGNYREEILFRSHEVELELATQGRPWSFDASGDEFKLGLEAFRISQAALFDAMMAVHASAVDPYPHQLSAVYERMLVQQPLRFVLADDPGAGKTIMAGLLIAELILRADAKRVLIVSPGSLTEQWQDELLTKFGITFEIFSREKQEQSASRNFFSESDLLICRLDQLSRSEEYQALLEQTEWDLVIVDEAHKLSVNYFGNQLKTTKRFTLGKKLGAIARHLLLMTATPHNGKEEEYQAWLSLLDPERFFGKSRGGARKVDVKDLMRRMVKEELLKFDGTRLFPERYANTAAYELSPGEQKLYEDVTHYVREEMNRADKLSGQKKNNVGFALTMLQRRLASSPAAIYESLKRRRKRLETKLEEAKYQSLHPGSLAVLTDSYDAAMVDAWAKDYVGFEEELSAAELEMLVDQVMDQATASETIPALEAEIEILKSLQADAYKVLDSGEDKKWKELSTLLQDHKIMRNAAGNRRKLIVFTEHKDTLEYLERKITGVLGENSLRTISGSTRRDARIQIQEEFREHSDVLVLVATDAAGEGVNLQKANLMVNYDLPWNPNRLEQRFGRIHRIGQEEKCYLWNLVAYQTREGAVFAKLFEKIEAEQQALGGKVFDVLGEALEGASLKDLLVEAIRKGEDPETQKRRDEVIESSLNTRKLMEIIQRNALVDNHMSLEQLYTIKEEMEKAEARKLQPHFIRSFFFEAFTALHGQLRPREKGRFEIPNVPAAIRENDKQKGNKRAPVTQKYERICFVKDHVSIKGKPKATFIHPMHPLMRATTDLTLAQHREKLKQGAVLVDPNDDSLEPKALFLLDHTLRESTDNTQIASRQLKFVTLEESGLARDAGWAPHLDLVPLADEDRAQLKDVLKPPWITSDLEDLAIGYAEEHIVPQHFEEVKHRRTQQCDKIYQAVTERLTKEIDHLSDRVIALDEQVKAGKQPRVQPENLRRRIDELRARLLHRQAELIARKTVPSNAPQVIGCALVIPQGLLAERQGDTRYAVDAAARSHIERIAMQTVMDAERALGFDVRDVSAQKCGWDITSRPKPNPDGSLNSDRHIEVKGRFKGKDFITVTKNEILAALNQERKYILAIVLVDDKAVEGPYYLLNPFTKEPELTSASTNFPLRDLLHQAKSPAETV